MDDSSDFKQLYNLAKTLRLQPWVFTDKPTLAFSMDAKLQSLLNPPGRLWIARAGTGYCKFVDRPELMVRLRVHAFSLYQYRKSQVIECSRSVPQPPKYSSGPFTDAKHVLLWRNVPGLEDKLYFDNLDKSGEAIAASFEEEFSF